MRYTAGSESAAYTSSERAGYVHVRLTYQPHAAASVATISMRAIRNPFACTGAIHDTGKKKTGRSATRRLADHRTIKSAVSTLRNIVTGALNLMCINVTYKPKSRLL
jgi:hypothetical protein